MQVIRKLQHLRSWIHQISGSVINSISCVLFALNLLFMVQFWAPVKTLTNSDWKPVYHIYCWWNCLWALPWLSVSRSASQTARPLWLLRWNTCCWDNMWWIQLLFFSFFFFFTLSVKACVFFLRGSQCGTMFSCLHQFRNSCLNRSSSVRNFAAV